MVKQEEARLSRIVEQEGKDISNLENLIKEIQSLYERETGCDLESLFLTLGKLKVRTRCKFNLIRVKFNYSIYFLAGSRRQLGDVPTLCISSCSGSPQN